MKSAEPTFLSLYTATPWFRSAKAGTKPNESYEMAYPNKTSACDKSLWNKHMTHGKSISVQDIWYDCTIIIQYTVYRVYLQFLLLHFPMFLGSIPNVTHLSSLLTPLAVAALAVLGPTGPCKMLRPTCQTIPRCCSKQRSPWLNQWKPTQPRFKGLNSTSVELAILG